MSQHHREAKRGRRSGDRELRESAPPHPHLVHIPMKVGTVEKPQENFVIAIANNELSISWDTFVWPMPIAI